MTLHESERLLIMRTLLAAKGNKAKTARMLGIGRQTLYNKLAAYEIGKEKAGEPPKQPPAEYIPRRD